MSRVLAPDQPIREPKRTTPGRVSETLERITGATRVLDAILIAGFFAALPIDSVLTFDVSGFTVRLVYPFMGLFLLLHLRQLREGFRAMPTVVLIVVAIAVSLPLTFDPKRSVGYTVWALFTILFALAATGYLRADERRLPAWLELYCGTAAAWAVVAIGEWFLSFKDANLPYGWLGSIPRLHALFIESSFLGFYLVPPLFLCLVAKRGRIWAPPIILAIALSTARTGAVGMVVGAITVLVLGDRARRVAVAKGALVVGLAAVMLAVPIALNYQPIGTISGAVPPDSDVRAQRIDKHFVTLSDSSSTLPRIESVKDAWATWKQQPVTGVGIAAYGQANHERGEHLDEPVADVLAMSLWFEALAEQGPLGLLALIVWAFAPVPFLWRARDKIPYAVPLVVAIVASAAMLLAAQTWWVPYRWVIWIFAYALVGPAILESLRRGRRAQP